MRVTWRCRTHSEQFLSDLRFLGDHDAGWAAALFRHCAAGSSRTAGDRRITGSRRHGASHCHCNNAGGEDRPQYGICFDDALTGCCRRSFRVIATPRTGVTPVRHAVRRLFVGAPAVHWPNLAHTGSNTATKAMMAKSERPNAHDRSCHPTNQTPEVNGGPRRFVDAAPALHKAALAAGHVTRMTVVQWKL